MFSQVCVKNSVPKGECLPKGMLGYTPLWQTPPWQTPHGQTPPSRHPRQTPPGKHSSGRHPQADTPGQTPLEQTPLPWVDTHPHALYGQQAGGMHPTVLYAIIKLLMIPPDNGHGVSSLTNPTYVLTNK